MKISELIKELEEYRDLFGDQVIYFQDDDDRFVCDYYEAEVEISLLSERDGVEIKVY